MICVKCGSVMEGSGSTDIHVDKNGVEINPDDGFYAVVSVWGWHCPNCGFDDYECEEI